MQKYFFSLFLAGIILIAGCGGSPKVGSTSTSTGGTGSSTSNVMAISVNGGPTFNQPGGGLYPNGAFASATICTPGSTSNCVTVNGLLVDTGSTGLRVLQSAVASLNLPAVNASNGSAAYDCVSFVDDSFMWGPVEKRRRHARRRDRQQLARPSNQCQHECAHHLLQRQQLQREHS